jgi:hypothetical protein
MNSPNLRLITKHDNEKQANELLATWIYLSLITKHGNETQAKELHKQHEFT